MEALPKADQRRGWVQDEAIDEKYGYLEICTSICGKTLVESWMGLLAAAVLVHIVFYRGDENTLGILCTVVTTVELIFLIGSIIPTEIALKNHFHKDGTRRQVPVH